MEGPVGAGATPQDGKGKKKDDSQRSRLDIE